VQLSKLQWFSLLVILAGFVVGIYFYSQLPDPMASHWNMHGTVNGFLPKVWGAFLVPVLAVGLFLLLTFIPKIDPREKNIQAFEKHYHGFIALMVLFLLYIQGLMLAWNLGYSFDLGQFLLPALGVLFFYLGVVLKHAKSNWFIGIRNPWTLSSDAVWDKTHRLGSKLFMLTGLIAVLGFFFRKLSLLFVFVPLVLAVIFLYVYSYLEYKKEKKLTSVAFK
jgi:uncharacterized membrane protein